MDHLAHEEMNEAAERRYGGFWIRLLAYVIDAIILGIISGVVAAVTVGSATNPADPTQFDMGAYFGRLIINFIVAVLYFGILPATKLQATLGKLLLGLKIIDHNGGRIGFGRAVGRYFGYILSTIIIFIGFIMIGVTDRKTGLHDKIAGTFVVKR
ncbi:putative RDD family membrane protein YckC [Scopulibacillus darangshiensis]|uniref:Putative RDD family membrane protein YckC n=1 Tax=Scopulibacillus darangshiensis TaxID=442528 RepID=A0A4R2P944_9BACL|nr:RDD family protein [Scopulibacillus darangshiensis]TCP31523.1 putative RDD family membrane protein YckC [Scopulibacillus darangshiensis]